MKKLSALIFATIFLFSSVSLLGVSATEAPFTPSENPVIYFKVPESWANYKKIFCHIWEYGNTTPLASWQSKKEVCTQTSTDGVFSYDISKVGNLEDSVGYYVIFSSDTGMQTYESTLSATCYGDTLYCNGTMINSPADDTKVYPLAYWENQDKTLYGPAKQVAAYGSVVGTALPLGVSPQKYLSDFLSNTSTFMYIEMHSGYSEQALIDNIAYQLKLSKISVQQILTDHPFYSWQKANSFLPLYLGDSNEDDVVNIKDATVIQKHIAGYEVYIETKISDCDSNQSVNIKDATAIQKYAAGLLGDTDIGKLFIDDLHTYPADIIL